MNVLVYPSGCEQKVLLSSAPLVLLGTEVKRNTGSLCAALYCYQQAFAYLLTQLKTNPRPLNTNILHASPFFILPLVSFFLHADGCYLVESLTPGLSFRFYLWFFSFPVYFTHQQFLEIIASFSQRIQNTQKIFSSIWCFYFGEDGRRL